ncbi:cyanate transporter CynX family [Klebsiella pneumoniae]|uniref:Cyanate transporter CynX family n=1 Tax=Klebsiella pneumoniae TaxID=573 RepID=A0A377V1L5_KLEPN|nr:cyanate transporter CynX family [Klebsiella pneumoniae]
MSSVISSTGRRPALLIAGILLIATTLRVVFTGAAPLLDAIRSDYGLTTAQTGCSLPCRCWPLALSRRWRQGLPAGSAWNAACCWRCC